MQTTVIALLLVAALVSRAEDPIRPHPKLTPGAVFPDVTVEQITLKGCANSFLKLWTTPYNLACYCVQLGRLDECQVWFKMAMAIDEQTVKRAAIDDPDLKPLWDSMSTTIWKKQE